MSTLINFLYLQPSRRDVGGRSISRTMLEEKEMHEDEPENISNGKVSASLSKGLISCTLVRQRKTFERLAGCYIASTIAPVLLVFGQSNDESLIMFSRYTRFCSSRTCILMSGRLDGSEED